LKKCPVCNKTGKKWKTIFVRGILIKAGCGSCGYSLDRTKGLKA